MPGLFILFDFVGELLNSRDPIDKTLPLWDLTRLGRPLSLYLGIDLAEDKVSSTMFIILFASLSGPLARSPQ